jgi:hypothetical protein
MSRKAGTLYRTLEWLNIIIQQFGWQRGFLPSHDMYGMKDFFIYTGSFSYEFIPIQYYYRFNQKTAVKTAEWRQQCWN